MRTTSILLIALFLVSCSGMGGGEKPTKEDITNYLKKTWEKKATEFKPKETLTINSIVFGDVEKANYANQMDGIPENATITNAKIDFTVTTYYDSGNEDVRRIMTAMVYKDKFNEWAVMNSGTIYPDK